MIVIFLNFIASLKTLILGSLSNEINSIKIFLQRKYSSIIRTYIFLKLKLFVKGIKILIIFYNGFYKMDFIHYFLSILKDYY